MLYNNLSLSNQFYLRLYFAMFPDVNPFPYWLENLETNWLKEVNICIIPEITMANWITLIILIF